MSGVLKNALDWASRPYGRSALRSKPVLTMTASPAFTGGVRAQQLMNETLVSIPARPVLRPQIVIGGVHEKVRDGRLIDEAALSFALAGVDDLLEEIRAARFVRAAACTSRPLRRCPVRRDEQFAGLGADIPTNLLAFADAVIE